MILHVFCPRCGAAAALKGPVPKDRQREWLEAQGAAHRQRFACDGKLTLYIDARPVPIEGDKVKPS